MDLRDQLDRLYNTWQALGPTSSSADLDAFGAFFDESCTAWLKSMREWDRPAVGRAMLVAEAKALAAVQQLEERRVVVSLVSDDGRTVACEMKNRLRIMNTILDPFYETAMATFNAAGLVTQFRVYSCRSPIIAMVQTATGSGPYTPAAAKSELE